MYQKAVRQRFLLSLRSFFALLASSVILYSGQAWALRVSPMSGEWSLSTSDFYEVTIINDAEKHTPVKISALLRTQDAKGEEVRSTTDDLVIFPPQILLKPREIRKVRINLKKNAKPDQEIAYRVIVEEVPPKITPTTSGIQFATRYVTAMYLLPGSPKPRLEVIAARRLPGGITVTLKNTGNAHTVLEKPELKFSQGDVKQVLNDGQILKQFTTSNFLAGGTHTIAWAWPTQPVPMIDLHKPFRAELSWNCAHCSKTRPALELKFD